MTTRTRTHFLKVTFPTISYGYFSYYLLWLLEDIHITRLWTSRGLLGEIHIHARVMDGDGQVVNDPKIRKKKSENRLPAGDKCKRPFNGAHG